MKNMKADHAFSRAGLILQAAGSCFFVVFFVFGMPYYKHSLAIFEIGILMSALSVRTRFEWVSKVLLVWFAIGLVLQATIFAGIPLKVFFAGLALVLLAGAVVSARDAYEGGYLEGWLFILAYPALIIPNLAGEGYDKFTILMGTLVAMLQILVLKRVFSGSLDSLKDKFSRDKKDEGE